MGSHMDSSTLLKRKVDELFLHINYGQKRYLWTSEDFLTQNKFYLSTHIETQLSEEENQISTNSRPITRPNQ